MNLPPDIYILFVVVIPSLYLYFLVALLPKLNNVSHRFEIVPVKNKEINT